MPKLTATGIKSLKAKGDVYERMDSTLPGFGVRVHPSGAKTFIYRFRTSAPDGARGKLRRVKLGAWPGTTVKAARAAYDAAKTERDRGLDPLEEKRRREREAAQEASFGDLAERFLAEHAAKRKSGDQYRRIIEREFLPAWRHRKAKDVTRRDVIEVIDRIAARGAPVMANRSLAVIRKCFNFALEKDLLDASPVANIKAPAPEGSRDRVLTDDEICDFWNLTRLSPRFHIALKLQLLTGQRIGEVVGLKWEEIDFDSGTWTLPAARAKNKQAHTVPLCKTAVGLLEELPRTSVFVFPSSRVGPSKRVGPTRVDSVVTVLRRSLDRAGLARFGSHDLRRTAATRISAQGVSREVLRQILNHKDPSVTGRYDLHRHDAEKRLALETWERKVLAILGKADADNVVPMSRKPA
jgi:integrase